MRKRPMRAWFQTVAGVCAAVELQLQPASPAPHVVRVRALLIGVEAVQVQNREEMRSGEISRVGSFAVGRVE